MRSTPLLVVVLLVACSSKGGGLPDATGAAGTSGAAGTTDASGTAGTTGTGGTSALSCPGSMGPTPAECCDSPEPTSRCAATLQQQLERQDHASCPTGGVTRTDETCGAYRLLGLVCFDSVSCVYDAAGMLIAWNQCGDTIVGPCGQCQHGGRHPDGGTSGFFTATGGGACSWAP